jgi:hypothetical protein
MKSYLRAAAAGALAFVVLQLVLPPDSGGTRWFLNSVFTVTTTLVVLALVAILVEVLDRTFLPWRPCWLAVGISIAFVGYLFAVGPGNLFPIVIVMGLTMLIPTAVIAGYIGMAIAAFLRRNST